MADQKITQLSELTTPALEDLIALVDDPSGSPVTKKATLMNVIGQLLADGWISANETWTYASATTFTISGDKRSKYQKGDKIKLTNSTVKYFYVIDVSYSDPNTTVTVTGGNDYALTNTAITNNYYSRDSDPFGFPSRFTFLPAIIGSTSTGTGTYTTQGGWFKIQGTICTFGAYCNWTAHTGTGNIVLSIPLTSASVYGLAPLVIGYCHSLTLPVGTIFLISYLTSGVNTTATLAAVKDGAALSAVAMDTSARLSWGGSYEI